MLENHRFVAHKRQEQNHQHELCGRKGGRRGGAKNKIVPDRKPLSGGGLDCDQGHRVQEDKVRENLGNIEDCGKNGHGNSPNLNLWRDFCTRKKPEGASEVSEKMTVTGNPGQSNKTEMTRTSENVMEISQYNKRLMQKQNMTKLGHEVWSEKSQTYVKSSLPENPTMKIRECQEAESLHRWSVEEQLV